MPSPEEFAAQRKLNKIKYDIEEFVDSLRGLRSPIVIHLIFVLLLLGSAFLAGTHNLVHAVFCALTAGVLFLGSRQRSLDPAILALFSGGT